MRKTFSFIICFTLCFSVFIVSACGKNENESKSSIAKNISVLENMEKAYIYGFPLVLMYITERVMTNPVSGSGNMPLNQFRNAVAADTKNTKQAFPDADFFYSSVWVELSKEPLVFEMPDMNGRYALFPVMDAWTNIITSPGKRSTGTKAQKYLITPPGWKGEIPAGMSHIKSPTNMARIRGKIQINSKEDGVKNVIPLQKKLRLVPLSRYGEKDYEPAEKIVDETIEMGSPTEQVFNMDIRDYFNLLNALMADNPPYGADKPFLDSIRYLKIAPDVEFDLAAFDEEQQKALSLIPDIVKKRLETLYSARETVNGWSFLPYADPSNNTDYEKRALNVYHGIKIDLPADAAYMRSDTDADGKQLSGQNKYILRLDKVFLPLLNAFWSLTMYNDKHLFVDNQLNRYSISDRKTLKINKDGSVDIYIQKDNPGKSKESNWLPAPESSFSLVFNAYWPDEDIIKKKWTLPAVKRISN